VGAVLSNDPQMGVFDFELSGSLAKDTGIAPLSDADTIIYLSPEKWRGSTGKVYAPSTVLRLMEERIEQTYRVHIRNGSVKIRRQTHSVGIRHTGNNSINIDVVPALCGDNDDDSHDDERICWIPQRGSGAWIKTSVRRQLAALNRLDGPGIPLRRAIRVLKIWRNNHGVELHSYGIETIAMILLAQGKARRSVLDIVCATLEWLSNIPDQKAIWCILFEHEDREPGRYAACAFDPAIPKNNVLSSLRTPECKKIATQARRTLQALASSSDLFDDGNIESGRRLVYDAFGCD